VLVDVPDYLECSLGLETAELSLDDFADLSGVDHIFPSERGDAPLPNLPPRLARAKLALERGVIARAPDDRACGQAECRGCRRGSCCRPRPRSRPTTAGPRTLRSRVSCPGASARDGR